MTEVCLRKCYSRNKWFHKTAPKSLIPEPQKSLSSDIERTRRFADTLRPSCDKRWWTARYNNAPEWVTECSMHLPRQSYKVNYSGTIPRLGFHREVQNINHFQTWQFLRICIRMGRYFYISFCWRKSHYCNILLRDNLSDMAGLSYRGHNLESNDYESSYGDRTYLIISKPVNLQNRNHQTIHHHHSDRSETRNFSTRQSRSRSNKLCRKSETRRSYSKSEPKEDKKHQQKICLVLSSD